jgi:hypothetical protein
MRLSPVVAVTLAALAACAGGTSDDGGDDDDAPAIDAPRDDGATGDAAPIDADVSDGDIGDALVIDAVVIDAVVIDAPDIDAPDIDAPDIDAPDIDAATDAATDAPIDAAPVGIITGGPCLSGAPGATGYRIRWANGGSTAYVIYEVNGLPDHSRDHAGAYGYTIPFTPQYVDTALAQGGLLLNSSSFVDLELTTAGISQITAARLAVYGRSYNTTTSGSFNWQTFEGVGAAPTNLVSNAAPYAWYTADMTTEISPGDSGVLIRIKAGPSSGSLAVNRIELCLQAN